MEISKVFLYLYKLNNFMNNNLRFPISDLAQELYLRMVFFAKSGNTNRDYQEGDITLIDEPNKYDLRFNNYDKYLKRFKK